jgi:2-polyprenyl-3-methyl-5-hydroxy-6-metoxy-1,4-benzoquinol methylase
LAESADSGVGSARSYAPDVDEATRLIDQYHRATTKRLGLPPEKAEAFVRVHRDFSRGTEAATLLEALVGLPGKRLLDVGAGTGEVAKACQDRGADVYVVEPNAEACRIAGMLIGADRALTSRAEDLPFADGSFDIVTCYNALEHVQDIHGAIAELVRVTRTGGHILVSVPNYLFPWEGHYRMKWLPVPKRIGAVYLRRKGRDPDFLLHHVNYTTYPGMAIRWRRHGLAVRNITREQVKAGTHRGELYKSRLWRNLALYAGLFPNVTWLLQRR